jgi:SNF2 family DNA or RNA helicase
MSLRSGAGVDGLQEFCRTTVFGELDWSPGVHEQCTGRIYRDGQKDPVVAYFMMSADGADPIMADVLGIKREQIEGVRNPGGDLLERVNTGENNLRQLARDFLERRGLAIKEPNAVTEIMGEP